MAGDGYSTTTNPIKVPSYRDIGIKAMRNADFQMARQMLQGAINQLEGQGDEETSIIEIMINIADTYLQEGAFRQAKEWYARALNRSERFQGKNSILTASILGRIAEVHILEQDVPGFQNVFDCLQRVYLLTEETDMTALLNVLIDLSWALCVHHRHREVQLANKLIAEIKQLSKTESSDVLSA
jgi:hypothetical protein